MNSMKFQMAFISLVILFSSGCGIQSIPKSKNAVEAAWAEVGNQYQRRADLIPNLVSTVQGYTKHERETLTAVVEARSRATSANITFDKLNPQSLKNFEEAQSALTGALSRLLVVVEKYPDLKANENFRDLQIQLEGTENRIAIARRRYIQTVEHYNNLVTVPPYSWTNQIFYHHTKMPQFSVEESKIKEVPKVNF